MKTTLLGRKLGMTTLVQDGEAIPITVVEMEKILCLKKLEGKFLLGFFSVKNTNAAYRGVFGKATPKRFLKESEVEKELEELKEYGVEELIEKGQKVQVRGKVKGRGFTGVMKRHNLSGLPKSHGVSVTHRSGGSIGTRRKPTRVVKGRRMPGRWGGHNISVPNLKVMGFEKLDGGLDAMLIKGAIPGFNGSYCEIIFRK